MSLRSLLLRWLNRTAYDTKLWVIEIDGDLLERLKKQAAREERSEAEMAAKMLSFAVMQRDTADENLDIWRSMTPREKEIVALVNLGYTNQRIADHLTLSRETVKSHTQRILRRFGLKNKFQLRIVMADWDFTEWDIGPSQEEE
jgi:DNA-binding NarL/FixJ family response regulator